MVLTPNQAFAITAKDKQEIKTLEKRIDSLLRECDIGGITIEAPSHFSPGTRTYEALIPLYQKAGWKVTYESDQRDGDYLTFTPSKQPRYN